MDFIRFQIGDFAYQALDIGERAIVRKVQIAALVFHGSQKVHYVLAGAQGHDYDGHDMYVTAEAAAQAAICVLQAKEAAKNESR